jgi:ankyrin repeat protein
MKKMLTVLSLAGLAGLVIVMIIKTNDLKNIAKNIIQEAESELVKGLTENDITKVTQALACGASVDSFLEVEENVEVTPLIFAIAQQQEAMAKELLLKGAHLERMDTQNKWTPLMWAIFMAGLKKISNDFPLLLLAMGSEVNPKDSSTSPLLLAIGANRDGSLNDLVFTLIANGADVNYQGLSTPLILAIKINNKSLVEKLIEFGADVTAADKKGTTPIQMAQEVGNQEIVELVNQKNTP